jgi:EmrB/QacA subfamily drug resistance transporter
MTETPAVGTQAPDTGSGRLPLMFTLVLATVLGSLDSSFVPLTFSDLIVDLDTNTSVVVWVALGYLISATGPMLFFARIGDRIGHRVLFRVGTIVYSLAMIACGFAPDMASLIVIRCIQGLGMAMFLPATFTLATRAYPPSERGKAVGILAAANAAGFILGPLFAGWLLDAYDWRATFISRTPLGILAIALAFLAVRRKPSASGVTHTDLDLKGAVLITVGLFGLLYGLNRLPVEDNHRDPMTWAIFVAGIVFLWWLVKAEQRRKEPLIDISLFREHHGFAKAALAFTILFASFPTYLFVFPIVLLAGLEFTAWNAGLMLGAVALVTFVVSPYAGKLSDRIGPERLCMTGAAFVMTGYLAMLLIRVTSGPLTILISMVLVGIGTGLFFSPNNALIIGSVPASRAGMAAGLIGTMRQAGYAVGFAIMASLFTFIQSRFEMSWAEGGVLALPEPMAQRLAYAYEAGGVWSPEMLVFIFHVSALLGAFLTLLTVLYSSPRFSFKDQLVPLGLSGLLAVAAILGLASRSELRLAESAYIPPSIQREIPPPKAFGWAAKLPPDTGERSTQEVWAIYCTACHGPEGAGIENLGLNLITSTFVARQSDEQLVEFLKCGRAADAEDSQSKRPMPGMESYAGFKDGYYTQLVERLRKINRAPAS